MQDKSRAGVPATIGEEVSECAVPGCGPDCMKPLPMYVSPTTVKAAEFPTPKQAFNLAADTTLGRCQTIHQQRGAAYEDTWDLNNVHAPVLRLALRETFGFDASPEELRIIMAASLCDVKDSRLIGKWHVDNIDDGINYRAAFAHWMQEYLDARPSA